MDYIKPPNRDDHPIGDSDLENQAPTNTVTSSAGQTRTANTLTSDSKAVNKRFSTIKNAIDSTKASGTKRAKPDDDIIDDACKSAKARKSASTNPPPLPRKSGPR